MQKDTNFGNAIILWHFRPGKCQESDPERHEFWERHDSSTPWAREMPKNPTQKYTNFSNAIILRFLGPENCQNPTMKDMNFGKLHSLTPTKNANKIRKVFVFQEFHTLIEMHSLTPSTLTNQPHWEHLIACFLQLQTNCDTFGQ